MFARTFAALFALAMLPSLVLGFEAQVVIKKVDLDKNVMVVFGGGHERTVKVAKDATFQDAQGNALAGGLTAKELQEGVNARLTVERSGQEPMIQAVRLGGSGAQAQAGRGGQGRGGAARSAGPPSVGKPSVGFKPLTEMTADDKYKGEDGGLYGGGRNDPPAALQQAAAQETAKIVPLGTDGKPADGGKIVFVSISMSNATMEFSWFKKQADADPQKSPQVTIADLAQGGQTMMRWADPDGAPWSVAMSRLDEAGLSPAQVQVAWVKLANARPTGELSEHGKQLESDTIVVLQNAKAKFPNLRIAYLGSRIYGGYADGALNPEPYAYEGAFVCRWLIQKQMQGQSDLNYDASRGAVKAPLLLWGPYFWADGMTPRKSDGLVWKREDLVGDGTHPSDSGRQKVSDMLLNFVKTDPLAKTWFVSPNSP